MEKAMAQFAGRCTFSVRWLPFLLNPDTPAEGVDKIRYLESRFGASQLAAMRANLHRAGEVVGISFNKGNSIMSYNTINSHRLIEFAERFGKQDAMVENLFKRYFENAENIHSHETLLAAAADCGLDSAETARFLASDELRSSILAQDAAVKRKNLHGVPHFTIAKNLQISGAESEENFAEAFETALG
eukprot:gnl/Hemi2/12976_TR4434_c0_g1_i1.p1 gnl/Hemi2/12976_TR4434_c0_g1~~gnl/Hemi2/12976_TR4434_c0_g1_i1.p1  ORF type:complete len:188 (-),score=58.75 gnl/Hemi2/12976_TR4434_c0_g1_i1:223-786(-)